jgi:dihydropteroate synthase
LRTSYLGSIRVGCGEAVKLAGVINMSPESFYQGSFAKSAEDALFVARRMLEQGADILDIGGISTAPYKKTMVSEETELNRVIDAVKLIKKETNAIISVDTFRSKVAKAALSAGADIINDVTALHGDAMMAKVIAEHSASAILMAKEDFITSSADNKPLQVIKAILKEGVKKALDAGIPTDQIVIDPGIGFFRRQKIPWYEWDLHVIMSLSRLTSLGYPIAVGISRKSFIGEITNIKEPENRLYGSLAAEAIAVSNGADIIRTHDPDKTLHAVRIAEAARKLYVNSNNARCFPEAKEKDAQAYLLPHFENYDDAIEFLELVHVDSSAIDSLSKKSVHKNILLLNIPMPLILIIKQEILSLGGDVAAPREAILGTREKGNALLMANLHQLKRLCSRLEKMEILYLKNRGMITPKNLSQLIRKIIS